MKTIKNYFLILFAFLSLTSCEGLLDSTGGNGLTIDEVVKGLKTALQLGTDTSVVVCSKTDGYNADPIIKIPLPSDASDVLSVATLVPDIKTKVDDVVLRVNRSAEDAATEAKPIFIDAITGMSINDGWSILNGVNPADTSKLKSGVAEFDSSAATHFLKDRTFTSLKNLFSPKINASLDKPLVKSVSTNKAWDILKTAYNTAATFLSLKKITSSLGEFVVGKALDGLFHKVGNEEVKIRRNPFAWAMDILERVFAYGKTATSSK